MRWNLVRGAAGLSIRGVVALSIAVATGLIGWRVLGSGELLAPATAAYPAATTQAPGVTGRLPRAALIVDGRLRVYAARRQVYADAPVDARDAGTPRWSYRRWPEQLNGVVAVGTTVISRWSDGDLVALDARTGTIAWRADGPAAGGFDGRRTGAGTVWAPAGLHTAGTTVLVTGDRRLTALDTKTGVRRWAVELSADCGTTGFTTAGGRFVCDTTAYDIATGRPDPAWPAGPSIPLGCDVARSHCGGLRDAAGHGWLTSGPRPQRATALDPAGSVLAVGFALSAVDRAVQSGAAGAAIVARTPVSGAEVWRWAAPAGDTAEVLAAQPGLVHLLTSRRELVTLDAQTGALRSRIVLAWDKDEQIDWSVGLVQATAGYVAVERLATPPAPDAADGEYYFSMQTVIVAAI